MRRFKGFALVLAFLFSACGQAGLGIPGAGPLGATKPSDASSTDKTDTTDFLDHKTDGPPDPSKGPPLYGDVKAGAMGGDASGTGSGTGGSTSIARIDPVSAQIGSSDIWCPEGADGSVSGANCKKRAMMMHHGDFLRDNDPTAAVVDKVEYVRVVEVPGDLAASLNITSTDDFLQRVRLATISDVEAKAVTYRDVAVSVHADGSFATPDLRPGLSLVYESPAKAASETPQNFGSVSEIQSAVSTAQLGAFRSVLADELKADPSLLMDVRRR
jgi:hypothetical protein